jgi:hypothetical protein
MDDKTLYIVNCGTDAISKLVVPATGGVKIPVTVGPKSFAQVTTQAVSGQLPWKVVNPGGYEAPSTPVVSKLPSVVAFADNYPDGGTNRRPYLTAVTYPTA